MMRINKGFAYWVFGSLAFFHSLRAQKITFYVFYPLDPNIKDNVIFLQ